MKILMIYMALCFQASRCENVIGYVGEQVVLRSGFDQSRNLSTIQWSIYDNTTFIATFRGRNFSVDWWPPFADRLKLDTASGDLTIRNLRASDSMKYTVDLRWQKQSNNKIIYLSVREPQKPNITPLHIVLDEKKCVISLKCTSPRTNISLTWKAEPDYREQLFADSSNRESVMWTSVKTSKDLTFSCITNDGNRNESTQWSGNCPVPKQSIWDYAGPVLVVIVAIIVLGVVIYRKELKSMLRPHFSVGFSHSVSHPTDTI